MTTKKQFEGELKATAGEKISLEELVALTETRDLTKKSIRESRNEGEISFSQISEELMETMGQLAKKIRADRDGYYFSMKKPAGEPDIQEITVFKDGQSGPLLYLDEPGLIKIFLDYLRGVNP